VESLLQGRFLIGDGVIDSLDEALKIDEGCHRFFGLTL
jgi:hypothetical protein